MENMWKFLLCYYFVFVSMKALIVIIIIIIVCIIIVCIISVCIILSDFITWSFITVILLVFIKFAFVRDSCQDDDNRLGSELYTFCALPVFSDYMRSMCVRQWLL